MFVGLICLTLFNCAFQGISGEYSYMISNNRCAVCNDNSWDTSTNETDCKYSMALVNIGG